MALPVIHAIREGKEFESLHGTFVEPLPSELLRAHRPTAHFASIESDGNLAARCSIWVNTDESAEKSPSGIIGHFACQDAAAGRVILAHACNEIRRLGCKTAIGPMDGNTWRSYRVVTDRGTEPPFFLEPTNPDHFPTAFIDAGFASLARYYSALATDLQHRDPRLQNLSQRFKTAGVTIRPLDPANFQQESTRICDLSLTAFSRNFLYTPIDRTEFLAQYAAVQKWVRPELCLLAEHQGRLVGFLFALPDLLEAPRGPINTIVIKTVAVLPGRAYAGLGSYLVEQVQLTAYALGFRRAIHALMHESNKSRNLSAHYASPIRGYTLFSKSLTAEAP